MRIAVFVAVAGLVAATGGQAAIMNGRFAGNMISGMDVTGVFGTPGDLSGQVVTGTFRYDTALLFQTVSGTANTAVGTAPGALTVTFVLGGIAHAFEDRTGAGLSIDTGPSQFSFSNANSRNSGSGSTTDDTFSLDVSDPLTPFLTTTALTQSFDVSPLNSLGVFTILNTGPEGEASGVFEVTSIVLTAAAASVPEPESGLTFVLALSAVFSARWRCRSVSFPPAWAICNYNRAV